MTMAMLDDDGMGSALRRARFPNSAEAALTFQHSLLATSEKLRLDSQRSRAFVAIEGSVQKTMEKRSQQLAAEKQQESEDASPPPPPPLPPGEPPLTELAQEEEPDAEALDEEGGESHSVFQGGCSLEDERRIEEFSLYDQRTGKMRDTTNDEQVARRKKLVSDWAQIVQSEKEQMKVNPRKAFAVHAPNLEDAFYLIAATYDLDGNGLLDEHETLVVLERCYLMDETLTPTKVKSFFRTWAAGCNKIIGENSSVEDIEDGIGYEEFSALLHWMADMKGVPLARCRARVIRLSHKMVDAHSSVKRRLALLFDQFCKREAEWMSAHEFTNLCHTTNLYKQGVFAAGDAFKIFHQTEGLVNQRMNFAGFMDAIARVGTMFNKDAKESADMFAAAVGRMDTDEETIRRIKLRIKQAASLHGQNGWRDFFHECDQDQSGYMDVDEFFDMCRHKLHMEDRKSHLQLLFEKLDEDDSG
eukprot:CAMPEP_0181439086 /NCGR_PEP_ID=MMETSP1110-20121109/22247_1 /TAXON_ID=174948 /ORGANISM="Symbiodinium sp., Strain CCMP421" /LENGTH=471 /DNA_ID=CAMNT_0023562801 /DNA_START=26 /DNA_END=1438 /DNA_ORIENTATION=+